MTHYKVEFHCLLLEKEDNIAQVPPGAYVSELHISERSWTPPTHHGNAEPPALCTPPATASQAFWTPPATALPVPGTPAAASPARWTPLVAAPPARCTPPATAPPALWTPPAYSPEQTKEALVFWSEAMSPRRGPSSRVGHSVKENAAPSACTWPPCSSRSASSAAPVHTVTPFNEEADFRGSRCGSPILVKRPAAAVAAVEDYDGHGLAVPVTPSTTFSLVCPVPVRCKPRPRLTHQDTVPTAAAIFQGAFGAADLDELPPLLRVEDNVENNDRVGKDGVYPISHDLSA
jgi:hypothetical protein